MNGTETLETESRSTTGDAAVGPSRFLFIGCQAGAEGWLKAEMARELAAYRFAFSRPGFVTYKIPPYKTDAGKEPAGNTVGLSDNATHSGRIEIPAVFARCCGFSLGKVSGTDAAAMSDDVRRLVHDAAPGIQFRAVHAWQRDSRLPGDHGFEPGPTPLADEVARLIAARIARPTDTGELDSSTANQIARPGDLVLDCVMVEPNEWWIGWHEAAGPVSRWPGGVCPMDDETPRVSRAYLKMVESLAWSQLPMTTGETVVELGSAPGGSCLALLDRGFKVIGVDPAEMDAEVAQHPQFRHIRRRSREVRRRDLRDARWLTSDLNVAPQYTLDTVEAVVTHSEIDIRGMLLTLKLPDDRVAADIPTYLDRIRTWGFRDVRARQLAYNRKEICVAASR